MKKLSARFLSILLSILLLPVGAIAAPSGAAKKCGIDGTYKLVSGVTHYDDEKSPDMPWTKLKGFLHYDDDGRMMTILTYGDRPKPDKTYETTPEERNKLYTSLVAYSGTFSCKKEKDPKKMIIEHDVDISWNETWTGTKLVRHVTKSEDGKKLTISTEPYKSQFGGRTVVVTLVFEKTD